MPPEEGQRLDAVHVRYRKVDSLTERALEAAESFGDEGFGTDEGMEKVFFLDGRNVYVGRNDIYARVKDIWRSNGWVFRKWEARDGGALAQGCREGDAGAQQATKILTGSRSVPRGGCVGAPLVAVRRRKSSSLIRGALFDSGSD